ncbi:MAG: leucyl/phenylalanyl-tRNA--protein transferase [Desulfuromonadales bacterium]|nr:leucyl/phenylalanyl-tRNA--protein transferase [Desulfuromonadales bacterium]
MPVFRLSEELIFPDPSWAGADGLLAVGGDLSVERLLLAYRLGIFPWYSHNDPILWWSPDPRCILEPSAVHVSRRLQRTLNQREYRVTVNRAFEQVVKACAQVRLESGDETWLHPEMQIAYRQLHELGYAHSVEVWQTGRLAGGLYGIAMGPFFFGESMFHYETDASKIVMVRFSKYLAEKGFELFDCQVPNPHLMRMGARNIPRREFLRQLEMRFGTDFDSAPEACEPFRVTFPEEI